MPLGRHLHLRLHLHLHLRGLPGLPGGRNVCAPGSADRPRAAGHGQPDRRPTGLEEQTPVAAPQTSPNHPANQSTRPQTTREPANQSTRPPQPQKTRTTPTYSANQSMGSPEPQKTPATTTQLANRSTQPQILPTTQAIPDRLAAGTRAMEGPRRGRAPGAELANGAPRARPCWTEPQHHTRHRTHLREQARPHRTSTMVSSLPFRSAPHTSSHTPFFTPSGGFVHRRLPGRRPLRGRQGGRDCDGFSGR